MKQQQFILITAVVIALGALSFGMFLRGRNGAPAPATIATQPLIKRVYDNVPHLEEPETEGASSEPVAVVLQPDADTEAAEEEIVAAADEFTTPSVEMVQAPWSLQVEIDLTENFPGSTPLMPRLTLVGYNVAVPAIGGGGWGGPGGGFGGRGGGPGGRWGGGWPEEQGSSELPPPPPPTDHEVVFRQTLTGTSTIISTPTLPKFLAVMAEADDALLPYAYISLDGVPAVSETPHYRGEADMRWASLGEGGWRPAMIQVAPVLASAEQRPTMLPGNLPAPASDSSLTTNTLALRIRMDEVATGSLLAKAEWEEAKDEGEEKPKPIALDRVVLLPERLAGEDREGITVETTEGRREVLGGGQTRMLRGRMLSELSGRFLVRQHASIVGGEARFDMLPPGTYRVLAWSKSGGYAESAPVRVLPGEETTVPLKLQPAASLTVEVELEAEAGKTALPVAGAEIVLRQVELAGSRDARPTELSYLASASALPTSSGGVLKTRTDGDGIATFENLRPMHVDIEANHAEHGKAYGESQLAPGQTATVKLTMTAAPVKVRLLFPDRELYASHEAQVTIRRSSVSGAVAREQGSLITADMPDTELEFTLGQSTWDFRLDLTETGARGVLTTAENSVPIRGEGPHDITFKLAPPQELVIRVLKGEEPYPDFPLMLRAQQRASEDGAEKRAVTDANGTVAFNLPEGLYRIAGRSREATLSEEVEVRIGTGNAYTFDIAEPTTLRLTMTNAVTKEPIVTRSMPQLFRVNASGPDGMSAMGRARAERSDQPGVLLYRRIPPGSYRIQFRIEGYDQLITDPIAVAQGPVTEVAFELKPLADSGKIVGTVARPDGTPLRQFTISNIYKTSGQELFGIQVRSEEGNYTVSGLTEGGYVLVFYPNGNGSGLLPHTSDGIIVRPGEETRYNVTFQGGGTVNIRALDQLDQPLPLVEFDLVGLNGRHVEMHEYQNAYQQPVSGASGEYRWRRIPPGTYRVYGTREGRTQSMPVPEVTVNEGAEIEVTLRFN